MNKLDIRHPATLPIALILGLLVLTYTTACSYYKAVAVETTKLTHSATFEDLDEFTLYLHDDEDIMLLTDAYIENSQLIAQAGELTPLTAPHYDPNNKSNRVKESNKDILSEMHMYLKPGLDITYQPSDKNSVQIPLDAINEVMVVKPNIGLSVLAFLGIVMGILIIVTIIIALTKSSCPYVYAFDGETLTFQGEIYSGANAKNLERNDILHLPALKEHENKYTIRISNELKEEQFINYAALAVVDHDPGTEVIPDQHGEYHVIKQVESPVAIQTSSGTDLDAILAGNDTLFFAFDEPEGFDNSVTATFANPNGYRSANLVMELKNSIWGDHIVAEFQALFGKRFKRWQKRQEQLTPQERRELVDSSGMLLGVFVRNGDIWRHAEDIYFVGPLGQRKMVVPIALDGGSEVQVRLKSGYRFWDLNSLKLSYDADISGDVQYPPLTDISKSLRKSIREVDTKYLRQLQTGDYADISWLAPPQSNSMNRSIFLECSGYYLPVRDFKGEPDVVQLEKFRQPGYFSEFSRDKYEEIEDIKVTVVSTLPQYE